MKIYKITVSPPRNCDGNVHGVCRYLRLLSSGKGDLPVDLARVGNPKSKSSAQRERDRFASGQVSTSVLAPSKAFKAPLTSTPAKTTGTASN